MRTRNVVREELIQSVAKCKNTVYIQTLLEIAEICRKLSDADTFKEVSELEAEQCRVVCDVMRAKHARNLRFVSVMLKNLEK